MTSNGLYFGAKELISNDTSNVLSSKSVAEPLLPLPLYG
jgi:hypothetical protein